MSNLCNEQVDTSNRFMVAVQNRHVKILNPPTRLTELSADEAMVLAAWLVAIASIHSSAPFEVFYDKVCS